MKYKKSTLLKYCHVQNFLPKTALNWLNTCQFFVKHVVALLPTNNRLF